MIHQTKVDFTNMRFLKYYIAIRCTKTVLNYFYSRKMGEKIDFMYFKQKKKREPLKQNDTNTDRIL